MLERILAAVIVLAVVSLLIFAGKNLTGSGTNPTQAQQPQQQPSGQNGGSASSRNGGQTTPSNTNARSPRQQNGTPSGGTRTHTVALRESPSVWWKPWTWHWRWPCPSGTRRNNQGTCSDVEDYQRQASYDERRSERRPRRSRNDDYDYQPRPVATEPRDERGYYHPEADPTGRYERNDPYIACRDGEACSRRQLCYTNYGYFDRPCYGEACERRPYWQRESYRAAFGYAPYTSHQGDPVPCN